ncbi:MAG: hypothetical protein ACR2NO_03990 [Chloroflexota bacterium]
MDESLRTRELSHSEGVPPAPEAMAQELASLAPEIGALSVRSAAGHVSRSTMHHAWLLQARVEKLTHLLDQCQVTDDPLATAAG